MIYALLLTVRSEYSLIFVFFPGCREYAPTASHPRLRIPRGYISDKRSPRRVRQAKTYGGSFHALAWKRTPIYTFRVRPAFSDATMQLLVSFAHRGCGMHRGMYIGRRWLEMRAPFLAQQTTGWGAQAKITFLIGCLRGLIHSSRSMLQVGASVFTLPSLGCVMRTSITNAYAQGSAE